VARLEKDHTEHHKEMTAERQKREQRDKDLRHELQENKANELAIEGLKCRLEQAEASAGRSQRDARAEDVG